MKPDRLTTCAGCGERIAGEDAEKCDDCGREFCGEKALSVHRAMVHDDGTEDPEPVRSNSAAPSAVDMEAVTEVVAPELDEDLTEYDCANCNERCINPSDAYITSCGTCLSCYLRYLSDRSSGVREPQNVPKSAAETDTDADGDPSLFGASTPP
jgi:hypothetical protein